MADVTLRSTLKQIDVLVDAARNEEARAEARHVLAHYPKNAQAYLALGRVLVAQRQWAEASEVLRRLLGAQPLDMNAHQLLSVAYQNLKRPDEALFHLERAFDQEPYNAQIVSQLRELLSDYRHADVEKLNLTAGAVARQYIRTNSPEQAVTSLQPVVLRMPERLDLRLMLAQAYWAAEQKIDAAETALQVLRTLPYAAPANQIIAEMWLEKGRPTDARLYITRLEEVDPYLALQLATGSTDDYRYMLPKLDYRAVAQQELATNSPDWLATIQDQPTDNAWLNIEEAVVPDIPPVVRKVTADLLDLLPDTAAPATPELPAADQTFTGGLNADVMRRLERLKGSANDATLMDRSIEPPPAPSELDSLLDDIASDALPDWMQAAGIQLEDNAPYSGSTGLTGMLSQIEDEEAPFEDDAWLTETGSQPAMSESSELFHLDFLTDLDANTPISPQSGRMSTGLTDRLNADKLANLPIAAAQDEEPEDDTEWDPSILATPVAEGLAVVGDVVISDDFLNTLQDPPPAPTLPNDESISAGDVSFEWTAEEPLQRVGTDNFFDTLDYIEEPSEKVITASLPTATLEHVPSSDATDPRAWMQGTDIEFDEFARSPFETLLDEDSGPIATLTMKEDPNAWLRRAGIEFDQAQLPDADEPLPADLFAQEDDPLAWMQGLAIEEAEPPADFLVHDDAVLTASAPNDALTNPAAQGDWQENMPDDPNWQDDNLDGFEWLSDEEGTSPDAVGEPWANEGQGDALEWAQTDASGSEFSWESEIPEEDSLSSIDARTGFTGMLDNLGDAPRDDNDPMGWMNRYKTDYLDESDVRGTGFARASSAGEYDSILSESPIDFFANVDDTADDPFNSDAAPQGSFGSFELSNNAVETFGFEDQAAIDSLEFSDDFGFGAGESGDQPDWLANVSGFKPEPDAALPSASNDADFDFFAAVDEEDGFGLEEDLGELDEAHSAFDLTESRELATLTDEELLAGIDDDFAYQDTLDASRMPDEEADWLAEIADAGALGTSAEGDLDFGFADNAMNIPGMETAYDDLEGNTFDLQDDVLAADMLPLSDLDDEFTLNDEALLDDEAEDANWMSAAVGTAPLMSDDDENLPATDRLDARVRAETAPYVLDFGTDYEEPSAASEFDFGTAYDEPAAASEFDFGTAYDEPAAASEFDFGTDYEEPAAASGFDFGTAYDEPAAASEFDFGTDYEEPAAASEFDFGTAYDEPAAASGFDFGTAYDEPAAASGFDFGTAYDEPAASEFDFGTDYEEPAVASEFDFGTDYEEPAAASEFDFGTAYDEPALTNDFDFVEMQLDPIVANDADFSMDSDDNLLSHDFDLNDALLADDASDEAQFNLNEPSGDTDWLAAMDDQQPLLLEEDEPDWMAGIGVPMEESAEALAVDEMIAEENMPQPVAYSNENDASNAPDWLNSLVPGVDVDYENLPQDTLVEDAFSDSPRRERGDLAEFTAVNDGFEWLEEIVEEETQNLPVVTSYPTQVAPLPPTPDFSRIGAAVAPPARAFVFSKPPAWVQKLRTMASFATTNQKLNDAEDEFADFDFDDDQN